MLAGAEVEHFGDRLAVGLEAGLVLPRRDEAGGDCVESGVERDLPPVPVGLRSLRGLAQEALALEPGGGGRVLALGDRVEEMAVEVADAHLVEVPDQRDVARLVGRHFEVRGAEEERLVALVGTAVEQVGRLGVGARHDDAGDSHDVELEARGVQPLVLLVLRDQHLAALVAALLRARALVLDVVARDAGLHEDGGSGCERAGRRRGRCRRRR